MSIFAKIIDINADNQVLVTIQEDDGVWEIVEETQLDNNRVSLTSEYVDYKSALTAFHRYGYEDAIVFFQVDAVDINNMFDDDPYFSEDLEI